MNTRHIERKNLPKISYNGNGIPPRGSGHLDQLSGAISFNSFSLAILRAFEVATCVTRQEAKLYQTPHINVTARDRSR